MAEQTQAPQIQFLLSDFNTRLKDLEERNSMIRERVLLLGKNLIDSREGIETEIETLKKQTSQTQKDLSKLSSTSKALVKETEKLVRKDEMIVIERMLKDFQPLEFMRRKDVEELIDEKLSAKQIKTSKTNE